MHLESKKKKRKVYYYSCRQGVVFLGLGFICLVQASMLMSDPQK